MYKILYLFVLLFFTQDSKPKVIVFFGDSLTAGYGLSTQQAFPALLEKKLNQKGHAAKIVNAGVSGETSAGGLNRIDWILRQPMDVFVLELGANDGLRGLPIDQTKKNLQAIITKVKEKYPNTKIVVAGMMVPPNLGASYSDQFKAIFPALAKDNNATLIPFLLENVAGHKTLNLADGIHPNVKGHEIIANQLEKYFIPLFK